MVARPSTLTGVVIVLDEISVKEASEMLRVSEETLFRWIRQGVVPTFKLGGEYRFHRRDLEEWAQHKRISAVGKDGGATPEGEEEINLLSALERGGIHYRVEGGDLETIYRQVALHLPFGKDQAPLREVLAQDLLERESLASTGVGYGLALPHPRHPRDWGFGQPVVGVFFLEKEVDMHALDGRPVYVLLALICSTVKGHLKMLTQVSHLMNSQASRDFFRTRPGREDILDYIRKTLPAPPQ
ncbi:MAG: PTS sugar transporter subunit IIA [Deltaproteobacteria bacterium]|nr:PTS sugar transporter subunit IIA [Deltaproteobacteria bacterium]